MTTKFNQVQYIEITEHQAGQRLDNFLFKTLKSVPKTRIYRILRKGEVRLNKKRCKPAIRLNVGDVVRLPPIRLDIKETKLVPDHFVQSIVDSIIFEDAYLLAINKPSGIAVHKGSNVEYGVIEALKQNHSDRFIELVHRIDRDTSGLLLLAKTRPTLLNVQEQIKTHSLQKTYRVLLKGDVSAQTINAPLKKGLVVSGERMVVVNEQGKSAITHIIPIETHNETTLVNAVIETGRTHQIRVHCAHVNHPIVGDNKYGNKAFNAIQKSNGFNRLSLHALELSFIHPHTHKRITLTAPSPDFLEKTT